MDASNVTSTDSLASLASLSKLTGHLMVSAHHAGDTHAGNTSANPSTHLNPKAFIAPPLSPPTGRHVVSIRRYALPAGVAAWRPAPWLRAHVPGTQFLRS